MKQAEFINKKQESWNAFENLLNNPNMLHKQDVPKLFRQVSHDLAIARAREYSPTLINKLNQLLISGQGTLYQPSNRLWQPLAEFVRIGFPTSLYELRRYIVAAHLLFYGVALIGFLIVTMYPDSIFYALPQAQISQIEVMYDPTSEHFSKERASDSDFFMFGHYIKNNISIAFQCFIGGILFGLGTLFYLLFNAVFFGVICGHIINIDYESTFFSFVITHGAFELTAIVLSAAAGLCVGKYLINPGQLPRIESLKIAGKKTFPLIMGVFLLLLLAAFIEAFWSSSRVIPNEVKYTVGTMCWIFMLFVVFRGKRKRTQPR